MPIEDRRPSSTSQRATERLSSIPEEEEVKHSTSLPPPPPTLGYKLFQTLISPFKSQPPASSTTSSEAETKASYGDQTPPPPKKENMYTIGRLRSWISWDIIQEKNFYLVFFSIIYVLATCSYFWATLVDDRTYDISTFLFHRCMAITYGIAFCSLWVQILGLCGENGILPISETIQALTESKKSKSRVPTLFWYNQSDFFIRLVCGAGLVASFFYFVGLLPTTAQICAFICFLSFKTVGREFFALQFDNLLLDSSIWAIFLNPIQIIPFLEIPTPPFYRMTVLFLLRWLGFRLLVGSGMCKISSGDKNWRNGMALTYHYWTQPMPNWISYYANRLPLPVQKFSCHFHFFVELAVPFGVFFPPLFVPTFLLMASLQIGIILTGNYGFFNLLSIWIPLSLVPDSAYPSFLRGILAPLSRTSTTSNSILLDVLCVAVVAGVLMLSLVSFSQVARGGMEVPEWIYKLQSRISRFGLMNYYGLFARMTTTRREVIIEGSNDGRRWEEYELFWKPGDVKRKPPFVVGHLPRLDWRLWFCQFTHFNSFFPGWFDVFLMKLLEGSPDVLKLIARNPFPEKPPRFLRAVLCDYNFADEEARKQGYWWTRSNKKLWWPPCTLHDGKMLYLR